MDPLNLVDQLVLVVQVVQVVPVVLVVLIVLVITVDQADLVSEMVAVLMQVVSLNKRGKLIVEQEKKVVTLTYVSHISSKFKFLLRLLYN